MKIKSKENYKLLLGKIFDLKLNKEIKNINEVKKTFENVFNKMPIRITKAVKLYYGIEKNSKGYYCKSHKEVGKEINDFKPNGVTYARARQMVIKGLRYLKHPKHNENFKKYLCEG